MLKKIKYYLVIFLSSLSLFLLIKPVFAGYIKGPTWDELQKQMKTSGDKGFGATPTETSMAEVAASVIKAFLSLLGIIFVSYIIYAGYKWMTASGDEEKVRAAKDTLQRAIIGLIIIIAAYAITYFVFANLPGGPAGGGGTGGSPPYP